VAGVIKSTIRNPKSKIQIRKNYFTIFIQPYSYGDSAGLAPDFPFNLWNRLTVSDLTIPLRTRSEANVVESM
jgi:hypothetical protein